MKTLKTYEVAKDSFVVAANSFWHDLKDFNLKTEERMRFMEEFKEAFQRSENYDLASMRVFDDVMRYVENRPKHKSIFKSLYNRLTKQQKGDKVMFQDSKYVVDNVVEDYRDDQNLYTLCRFETTDGTNVKVVCHKVLAYEDELDYAS